MDDALQKKLDPDGRYLSSGVRDLDEKALHLLSLLPEATVERTRDAIQIDVDVNADNGIVLILTPETLKLHLPSVEWTTPYSPAPTSVLWKRIKWDRVTERELPGLIDDARKKRRSQYNLCKYCAEKFPPELRHSRNVCHGCAEEYLGIDH